MPIQGVQLFSEKRPREEWDIFPLLLHSRTPFISTPSIRAPIRRILAGWIHLFERELPLYERGKSFLLFEFQLYINYFRRVSTVEIRTNNVRKFEAFVKLWVLLHGKRKQEWPTSWDCSQFFFCVFILRFSIRAFFLCIPHLFRWGRSTLI